jgi:hypothetical protein
LKVYCRIFSPLGILGAGGSRNALLYLNQFGRERRGCLYAEQNLSHPFSARSSRNHSFRLPKYGKIDNEKRISLNLPAHTASEAARYAQGLQESFSRAGD